MPVGGVTGGAGVILRVVSRGSCARAGTLVNSSEAQARRASASARDERRDSGVELVVFVSLTDERTVYFTL